MDETLISSRTVSFFIGRLVYGGFSHHTSSVNEIHDQSEDASGKRLLPRGSIARRSIYRINAT